LREQAKIKGLKFRRQQPIHPFIADFACMEARLIIELDGMSHDARLGYDEARDKKLKQMGYFILRFRNQDVAENLEYVVDAIITRASSLVINRQANAKRDAPLPNPPRKGEGTAPFSMATGHE
jgi:very-short-patch-repair endonuclease